MGGVDEGLLLLVVGAILAASVVLALGAARTGLPVLVAFLGLGMLLGSDGPGGIAFDDARLAREAGTVGLSLILYEGGLQTSWRRLREVVVPATLLSTVGVCVSAVVTGLLVSTTIQGTTLGRPAKRLGLGSDEMRPGGFEPPSIGLEGRRSVP